MCITIHTNIYISTRVKLFFFPTLPVSMACFTIIMFDEEPRVSDKKTPLWQLALFIMMALLGISAIGGGVYFLIETTNTVCISEKTVPIASKSAQLAIPKAQLYVDLAGAVNKPGLYTLDKGSRLAAVIEKADGFSKEADPGFVSQELNLAKKLEDGDKIYIFSQEERQYEQEKKEFCSQPGASLESKETDGLISINQASSKDLQSLEGIGEKRAGDIVENRPYSQLSDLVTKKVISETVLSNIENRLKL